MSTPKSKTLIFCTAFAINQETWLGRYRRWIDAIKDSALRYDQIILMDDGSPVLPNWDDVRVVNIGQDIPITDLNDGKILLLHFDTNLGRKGINDFAGWYRSFCYAGKYAVENNFNKIIHVESDSFLISDRIREFFNEFEAGWLALWCRRWLWPETAVQILAGNAVEALAKQDQTLPHDKLVGKWMELSLPFTHVESAFNGDRYGEYLSYIPRSSDFAVQTHAAGGPDYFWWLDKSPSCLHRARKIEVEQQGVLKDFKLYHENLSSNIRDFISALAAALSAATYFETTTGVDCCFDRVLCDVVAVVDVPRDFVRESPSHDAVGRRRITSIFAVSSREYFDGLSRNRFYQHCRIDLGFLNGKHHIEIVLREFIEIEKRSTKSSLVVIGNCLPSNARMAEREFYIVDAEDPATKFFWTGDIWKILFILRKYRPDLELSIVSCAPAGLLFCRNLDPSSKNLELYFNDIIREFIDMKFHKSSFVEFLSSFDIFDAQWLLNDFERIDMLYGGTVL